ncbi:hypothetical protein D1159_04550 [Pseudoflavonifractor sp. 524-17]|uniref:hypothetical protein n=1 Tax=Pseudoflavonifractor sp. 524-17 TaxID=2304577 RepID=UPI001379E961|nr:hypothetical protein [Pseudoflavonifractor sp. 524-17]NCE63868.1 hypothetical protein [Pseudoflavonifractor sp. 524-17]
MGIISIGVGTCTLGRRQVDRDGNVASETPARWEADPAGGSVAIVSLNPETMEQDGPVEVFGDWQAGQYLARVVELIHPNRQINVPDLEAMIRRAAMDGLDLCDYCEDCYMCRDCIVKEWKEDPGGE